MVKVIIHHLGLGDQIMLNGMIRHFAEDDIVYTFCKTCHVESVEFMYRDNKNIRLIPVDNTNPREIWSKVPKGEDVQVIPLATYGMDDRSWSVFTNVANWAHGVYLQAKVNPLYMYTKFRVIRDKSIELPPPTDKDYIFVHDDPERNRNIKVETDLHVYKPQSKVIDERKEFFQCDHPNIFSYIGLIEKAKEVHCMNSSYNWMIELMKIGDKSKNFFHTKIAHLYYTEDTVKTVFSDNMWTFQ